MKEKFYSEAAENAMIDKIVAIASGEKPQQSGEVIVQASLFRDSYKFWDKLLVAAYEQHRLVISSSLDSRTCFWNTLANMAGKFHPLEEAETISWQSYPEPYRSELELCLNRLRAIRRFDYVWRSVREEGKSLQYVSDSLEIVNPKDNLIRYAEAVERKRQWHEQILISRSRYLLLAAEIVEKMTTADSISVDNFGIYRQDDGLLKVYEIGHEGVANRFTGHHPNREFCVSLETRDDVHSVAYALAEVQKRVRGEGSRYGEFGNDFEIRLAPLRLLSNN